MKRLTLTALLLAAPVLADEVLVPTEPGAIAEQTPDYYMVADIDMGGAILARSPTLSITIHGMRTSDNTCALDSVGGCVAVKRSYTGTAAKAAMVDWNAADLSATPLRARVLSQLAATGDLPPGTLGLGLECGSVSVPLPEGGDEWQNRCEEAPAWVPSAAPTLIESAPVDLQLGRIRMEFLASRSRRPFVAAHTVARTTETECARERKSADGTCKESRVSYADDEAALGVLLGLDTNDGVTTLRRSLLEQMTGDGKLPLGTVEGAPLQ